MKKIIIIVFLALLLSGCSIEEISETSMDKLIDKILNNEGSINNRIGRGYTYYIPINMSLLEISEDNEIIFSMGNKYYLYFDLISYKNRVKIDYVEDKSIYFSKAIFKEDKYGYIEINKVRNQYYVEMMYNYAKIEAYVYEHQLQDAIINASYILGSIKYNEKIIDSLIAKRVINTKTTEFDIFKPTSMESVFIENIEEDIMDIGSTLYDPDVININLND